jgi:hypothetical protein
MRRPLISMATLLVWLLLVPAGAQGAAEVTVRTSGVLEDGVPAGTRAVCPDGTEAYSGGFWIGGDFDAEHGSERINALFASALASSPRWSANFWNPADGGPAVTVKGYAYCSRSGPRLDPSPLIYSELPPGATILDTATCGEGFPGGGQFQFGTLRGQFPFLITSSYPGGRNWSSGAFNPTDSAVANFGPTVLCGDRRRSRVYETRNPVDDGDNVDLVAFCNEDRERAVAGGWQLEQGQEDVTDGNVYGSSRTRNEKGWAVGLHNPDDGGGPIRLRTVVACQTPGKGKPGKDH